MSYYARIRDRVVREVQKFESVEGRFHPSMTWVEVSTDVSVGDRYDDGEFSDPPTCVVKLGSENKVEMYRLEPHERLEDQPEWIEASTPPTVDEKTAHETVRYYDPDTDEWDHEYRKIDPNDLRRDYAGNNSRQKVRDALNNGNVDRAVEELAHIVTGDDRFDNS